MRWVLRSLHVVLFGMVMGREVGGLWLVELVLVWLRDRIVVVISWCFVVIEADWDLHHQRVGSWLIGFVWWRWLVAGCCLLLVAGFGGGGWLSVVATKKREKSPHRRKIAHDDEKHQPKWGLFSVASLRKVHTSTKSWHTREKNIGTGVWSCVWSTFWRCHLSFFFLIVIS